MLFYQIFAISICFQILFLVVFVTRYLDLVTNLVSIYNTSMKIFFISSAAATVYLMYFKFKATYDGNHDTFRVEFLLGPALLLISHSSRSSSHSVHKNFQVGEVEFIFFWITFYY